MALALVFRLAFWALTRRVVDSADAIHYVRVAEQFFDGEFLNFNARITLLYPALCALTNLVAPDLETACRVVSLLASSLLVYPVYRITAACHGRSAARYAALMVAIGPWFADYGSRIAPEALMSVLWFAAIWAFARSLRDGGPWLIVAPAAFFALHLTRPEGTFLMLAAPLGGMILCVGPGRAKAKRLIPFIVTAGLLLAAYAAFMRLAVGEATINPRISDAGDSLRHIFVVRAEATVKTFLKLLGEVIPIMLGPVVLVFAGVGLFRPALANDGDNGRRDDGRDDGRRDLRLELLVIYFALVQAALAVLSTYASPRYIMPLAIAAAIWAGRGMAVVARQAAGLKRGRWLRFAPVILVVGLWLFGAAVAVAPEYLGRTPQQPREFKIAGQWMKAQGLEPGLIVTRKPWVGFYAGMDTVGPEADASVERVIAYGRQAGARYLVIDERHTAKMVPGLQPLLDPANAPPQLESLNAALSPYPDARIVIYRFREL